MRPIGWLLVAALGFALMVWSYFTWQRIDETVPWARGLLYLAAPGVQAADEPTKPERVAARVRLLPISGFAAGVAATIGALDDALARAVAAEFSEKLLLLAPADAGVTTDLLAAGRLPQAGADEALAGFQARHKDCLEVEGHTLKIVGRLRRDVALLATSYLVPPHDSVRGLFDPENSSVHAAALVRLTPQQLRDREVGQQLKTAFPRRRFAAVTPAVRADRVPYYLYVAGQAVLWLGGSGFLIGIFTALGRRERFGVLRGPLGELTRRRRLLWAVHLAYFGLAVAAAVVMYDLAEVQTALMGLLHGQIADERTLLGVMGKSYSSGSMPLAAAVTFLVNFFIGSLACITLPSLVVPGVGSLLAAYRALLWGALLAPTLHSLSYIMLPHSWTILLEGEGYILATFFALLIPIYICQPSLGGGVLKRYGRALLMNLAGNLLVAVVLLAAACYEATEVIWMMR
jgi:hypothetical protein